MQKGIFLDRDNTIIVDDEGYFHEADKLQYLPGAPEALRIFHEKGYLCFIVTNQSGINRDLFTEMHMHEVHDRMNDDMESWGLPHYTGIAFCPHRPDEGCDCRKPSPKMILDLAKTHEVDLTQSYMIGDKESDYNCGIAAGTKAVWLGRGEFSTLLEFAKSL